MRILIAEDDLTSRAILAGMLKKEGHEVIVTVNGAEAWKVLQEPDAPALVILGRIMPEMDGLEVVRRVRALHSPRPPYIIILTARGMSADIIDGIDAGADDYLTRPFSPGELRARVSVGRRMVGMHDALSGNARELRLAQEELEQRVASQTEELRVASDELRVSEEKFRSIVESSPMPMYLYRLESGGRLVLSGANPAADRIIGISHRSLLGKTIEEAFPPLAATGIPEMYREVARGKLGPQFFEVPYRDDRFSGYYSVSVFRISAGAIAVNFMDITERRQMEEALRESEEKHRIILEESPDPVFSFSSEGRYIYVNQALCRAFGMTAGDIIGKRIADVFPPEEAERRGAVLSHVLHTGKKSIVEGHVPGPNGGGYYITTITPIRDKTGATVSVICSSKDITELKRIEDALEQYANELEKKNFLLDMAVAEAEAANRAKSEFLANMSHEIRTPLNAVLGFAQILDSDPSLTPRQAEHVRIINRSGVHLLRLINDILDMSKIEAGRTVLNLAPFCLHDFLDDIEMMFRSRANAKGLQLFVDRGESLPYIVTGDEGKLRQVFVNLIGNAVKFTGKGSVAVRIHAGAAEKDNGGGMESIRLTAEVEDTGPGISEEERQHIFSAFHQGKAGVKVGGTGLGLAISSRFVEMMGGTLTVISHMGRGSCFRFDVLLEPSGAVAKPEKPLLRRVISIEPGTGPYRILVVDDVEDNRSVLRELLCPAGFEVAEACNGAEAIGVFGRWAPHAVLMDIRMPVMDGYEAIRRLRTMEAGRTVPVIAVTASVFDDSRNHVVAAGADAYVRKPFHPEEVFDALGKSLNLRYVFAGEASRAPDSVSTEPLTPETVAALPKEIIRTMRKATAEGDIDRLKELIGQAKKFDIRAALTLNDLADRFDYVRLDELLAREE